MYKFVYCVYMEDLEGEGYLAYVPMGEENDELALDESFRKYREDMGKDILPGKLVIEKVKIKKLRKPNEDSMFCLVYKGDWVGSMLTWVEDLKRKHILLDMGTGQTIAVPFGEVVELPTWDFNEECWALIS